MNLTTHGFSPSRRPHLSCVLALLLLAGVSPRALAAGAGEKTVTGKVQEVSVGQRAGQFVIYLRLSGVSRRLWAPEGHGDNPNTIHKGDHFRITFRTATGEMLIRE